MRASSVIRYLPLAIAALLAGCAEHITDVTATRPSLPAPTGASSILSVTCSATIATHAVNCGNPATSDEVFTDVVIGGQNVYVTLTSSGATTTAGVDCPNALVPDGTKSCFAFDVTVQNLIPQPLGTSDTTATHALHPNGVRVFFQTGPTSTGLGVVILANPDGTGNFTGSSQPYFQNNQVLVQNTTSALKHWEFQYSPAVTAFNFTVYVSAPVPWPDGYVDGLAKVITLNHSGTFTLPAVSRSVVGNADGAGVVFTSANPALASMSGNVVSSGATDGTTTVTAQSGLRPGISTTWISVCPSIVVSTGSSVPASIAGGDCFAAFEPDIFLPSTTFKGDLYRVTILAGQTIDVIASVTGLDTYMVLADRLGNMLSFDDDGGGGGGSRIIWTNNTGLSVVAIIQVTTFSPGATGTYTLNVSVTP